MRRQPMRGMQKFAKSEPLERDRNSTLGRRPWTYFHFQKSEDRLAFRVMRRSRKTITRTQRIRTRTGTPTDSSSITNPVVAAGVSIETPGTPPSLGLMIARESAVPRRSFKVGVEVARPATARRQDDALK
jgi:hypothetical protein